MNFCIFQFRSMYSAYSKHLEDYVKYRYIFCYTYFQHIAQNIHVQIHLHIQLHIHACKSMHIYTHLHLQVPRFALLNYVKLYSQKKCKARRHRNACSPREAVQWLKVTTTQIPVTCLCNVATCPCHDDL